MVNSWLPSASIETLKLRSALLTSIRHFFSERSVLEVETPSLSHHTITDPYIEALQSEHSEPGAKQSCTMFLQTSPEYAMKRLLAAGSGDIFQICKAFRNDEVGQYHNPEFTMLEWYRLNYSMQDLIDEVSQLLLRVLPVNAIEQYTYTELFQQHCQFDPISISYDSLIKYCEKQGLGDYLLGLSTYLDNNTEEHKQEKMQDKHQQEVAQQLLLKDSALQVLFNQLIEPNIGQHAPVVVTHFPASQASLATLSDDAKHANRFEVYYLGIELANGFNELQDPKLQEARFCADNQKRQQLGLRTKVLDPHFMAALHAGLPACSGVAMGLDRLFMLALNKSHIKDVLSFSYHNC